MQLQGLLPGELFEGQWLAFYDKNGRGYAQPDYYVVGPSAILLIEVKLKQNTDAHLQLVGLYAPLLTRLYSKPVWLLQIFKFPRWEGGVNRLPSLEAIFKQPFGALFEWHWLGD